MSFRVVRADMRRALRYMAPESVDAIVCDPPYELGFMGKRWDRAGVAFDPATWAAGLRVLKPGGRLLAFGAPRTAHRIWCAIEDAGFVLEDSIEFFFSVENVARELWDSLDDGQRAALAHVLNAILPGGDVFWMFGSGFPKHRSKLKPAYEPVCVARKGGVSDLNIEGARINPGAYVPGGGGLRGGATTRHEGYVRPSHLTAKASSEHTAGRWPPNVAMDEVAARALDEMSGEAGSFLPAGRLYDGKDDARKVYGRFDNTQTFSYGDSGGASRFMYVAKASRAERDCGLEGGELHDRSAVIGQLHPGVSAAGNVTGNYLPRHNPHPTVKPVALMRWLVRLVTQPGDLVLDPFTGSGTTGIACMLEGRRFVGIEMDPAYAEIARKRIGAWKRYAVPDEPSAEPCPDTLDLFDTEAA